MKISIVGTGVQGSAIALILTRITEVSEIICSDIDYARAGRVARKLGDERLHPERVDAGDTGDLLRVLRGSDVVINATLPRFNRRVMDSALRSGAHYVALASDDPLGELGLTREWAKAGLTAVIYQGGPFVMNVLVRRAAQEFDLVNEIRLRFGWKRLGSGEAIGVWSPSWSPEVALNEWLSEPVVYENGRFKRMPIFSGMEDYPFPAPMGKTEVCFVDYEPVYTLPRSIGKGLRYVDCKIPPDKMAGALIRMGFASEEPIAVGGVKVVPKDVLLALVSPPADAYIEFLVKPKDIEQPVLPPKKGALICYLAELKGERKGKTITRTFYRISSSPELFKRYGTPWAEVAVPVSLTATMLAKGEIETKGAIPPECLDLEEFLERLAEWGITFKEKSVEGTLGANTPLLFTNPHVNSKPRACQRRDLGLE
jgi:saccharopine dehydrogenase (NAD+, L-lysine-forming)